jgi:hypothetical protein
MPMSGELTTLPAPDTEAVLARAAGDYLAARGRLMSALEQAGRFVQMGLNRLPPDVQKMVAERARDGLELAFRTAILGMEPGTRPERSGAYRLGGVLSGAMGGMGGFATTLAELPVTTGLIMRSVADIARGQGLDLRDPAVRAACIEVFAFGGPLEEDDDADIAFWATRLAGQEMAQLMASVVVRYAPNMMTKLGAQAVPLVGAAVGAGLNLVYMDFYQRMARVVFALQPLEQAEGRAAVRRRFAAVVDARRGALGEDARFRADRRG